MRTTSTAAAVAVVCLAVGAAAAGWADGTTDQELSAGQMLDHANGAMRGLTSVTIDAVSIVDPGDDYSSRLTTDLKARCAFTSTSVKGAGLEQIRIGRTDYVRPDRAYLKQSGRDMPGKGQQNRWIKTPASEAQPGDGLAECTQDFTSFGVATKGRPTKVNGSKAVPLIVTDKADKGAPTPSTSPPKASPTSSRPFTRAPSSRRPPRSVRSTSPWTCGPRPRPTSWR